MAKMIALITSEAKGTTIMGGDLNLIMDPKLDCQYNVKHKAEKTSEIGIIDVWRKIHPNERDYTYYSKAHNKYSRLDYFFMFKSDIEKVKQSSIGKIDISDHAIISIELTLAIEKGVSTWRLNNSLLNDIEFKKRMATTTKQYIKINDNGEVSPLMVWEGAKAVIRGEIIAFSSLKRKQRGMERNNLVNKQTTLQEEHKRSSKQILNEIDEIKKKNRLPRHGENRKGINLCQAEIL